MSPRTRLSRHAQTLLGALGRLAAQPLATFMTMAVIGLALALPLLLDVLVQNTRNATSGWDQAFDVSVYLRKVNPQRLQGLAKQLRALPEVAGVRVVSAEQALADFRQSSGFGAALDSLADNPLPDTLIVSPRPAASTPAGVEGLKAAITALPEVQAVQVDADWVRRMQAILNIVRRGVGFIGALLGLAVLLVVGNTIRLDILNRRTEIEVMKLVGATDGFARRPFLYSGLLYGFGGGLLALFVVAAALHWLGPSVGDLAGLYRSRFELRGLGFTAAAELLGVSTGLGGLGSWLAATRHIRAIEPT